MDEILQSQQIKAMQHKYFIQSRISRYHLKTFLLLATAFLLGWKAERKHWDRKVVRHGAELGRIVFLNYLKKMFLASLR